MNGKVIFSFIAIYCLAAGMGFVMSNDSTSDDLRVASYILQGKSTEAVVEAVASVDGQITHEFGIINAVAAILTIQQHDALLVNPEIIAINEDVPIKRQGGLDSGVVSTDFSASGAAAVAGQQQGAGI